MLSLRWPYAGPTLALRWPYAGPVPHLKGGVPAPDSVLDNNTHVADPNRMLNDMQAAFACKYNHE